MAINLLALSLSESLSVCLSVRPSLSLPLSLFSLAASVQRFGKDVLRKPLCPPQNSEEGLHERLSSPCQDCLLSLESGSRTQPQRQAKRQILPWVRGSRRGRGGAVEGAVAGATAADAFHAAFSATTATCHRGQAKFCRKKCFVQHRATLKSTLQPAKQHPTPACWQNLNMKLPPALPPSTPQPCRKRTWRTAEHTARATPINTR